MPGVWEIKREDRLHLLVVAMGLGMALYHLLSSQIYLQDAKPTLNTHLGFALSLIFLDHWRRSHSRLARLSGLLCTILTLACYLYIQVLWQDLELRAYFNTTPDLVVGVILVGLVLEATRRDFGWLLPVLTLLITLYPVVGHDLPEPFRCSSLDLDQTISNLGIGLQNGIFGIVLPTSANYLFLFVLFGGILQEIGGTEFFMLLAKKISGKMQGGPGVMAVVSSSLVGSITGSAAANVAITGSFTIPLMKKAGYRPSQAAAIEAAASNGGQITPPVMGIVAFGMAGITGIPYLEIISMALLPALLYFWATGLYVYLRAGQLGICRQTNEDVSTRHLLVALPSFATPFLVILILLIKGFRVSYVAFWAIVASLLVSLASALVRGESIRLERYVAGFVKGARSGAGIAASAACVGLIMATVTMSGIGVKLAAGIQDWSGGLLFPAMVIIAAVCVFMGCGGPSLTAYLIVSMFAVPAVTKMGIPFETAHFFTMYFGVFAFLTPPVALLALIAAKLAGASYFRSSVESTKAAVGGFLIPFMFVYCPVLLLRPMEPVAAILGILSCVLCLWALETAFVGYCLSNLLVWERCLAFTGGVAYFISVVSSSPLWFLAGTLAFGVTASWQYRSNKLQPPSQSRRNQ